MATCSILACAPNSIPASAGTLVSASTSTSPLVPVPLPLSLPLLSTTTSASTFFSTFFSTSTVYYYYLSCSVSSCYVLYFHYSTSLALRCSVPALPCLVAFPGLTLPVLVCCYGDAQHTSKSCFSAPLPLPLPLVPATTLSVFFTYNYNSILAYILILINNNKNAIIY
jgi:hypothetical protein